MYYSNIDRCIENCLPKILITKPIKLVAGGCENQSCKWYQNFGADRRIRRDLKTPSRERQNSIDNFILNPIDFQFNHTYTVMLQAQNSGQVEEFAKYTFVTDSPPTRGLCVVSPERGTAIETEFQIVCSGWMDEEMPLWFEFYSEGEEPSQETILAYGTSVFTSALHLPPGDERRNNTLQLFVKVFDATGAFQKVSLFAQVIIIKLNVDNDE